MQMNYTSSRSRRNARPAGGGGGPVPSFIVLGVRSMGDIRLKTVSVVDAVYDTLEQDIFSFHFAPGEKITEAELTKKYGVSRNTLREAVTYLISDSLLVKVANKGVYVKRITAEDVREIFHLRRLFELEAIDGIGQAAGITDSLRTALLRLERTDISRDWKEYVAADFEFHAALVDAAGSSRLSKLYHTIGKEVKLCIYQSRNVVAMRNENVYHHRQVLEFLEQGDKKNAKLILARHLDAAVEGFELGFLRQQETAVNA